MTCLGNWCFARRKAVTIRSDVHGLWLANSHDLWYGGGGAYQPWTFRVYGTSVEWSRPGLARVYDTSADFQMNRAVSLGLYFGYAQGGPVIQRIFAGASSHEDSNSPFGFIEVNYRF